MPVLPIDSRLDSNPKNPPQFSVTATLGNSETLPFADPRATRALVALMDMEAVIGGAASHYGGPAAFAEMMSAAYGLAFEKSRQKGKDWTELFHIINDAGHCENGIYALKANYRQSGLDVDSLKGFRSIESQLTGHGEAHLFPEGVYLSNGPLGSSAGQAQGLAAADKASGTGRTTLLAISDGACMEGEAKEAFAAIPGLAKKGRLNPFILLLSDNNTKLSGRIDEDAFSMNPTFSSLETLGWKLMKVENGNDLQECVQAIETAMAETTNHQPTAIWFKTTKGIGTAKTAESSSGGHGFPLKKPTDVRSFVSEIYGGEDLPELIENWVKDLENREEKPAAAKPAVTKEKIQVGISKAMIEMREAGAPVVSVTSDLPGSTGVAGFRKAHPEDCFDVGVAESNMVSMGAGLSKQGYIPVVDTFAQFGVTKGALPLTMANLSLAPVICVYSHTGFQDAADGASHQALSYFAMTSSIPHVKTYSLSCSEEAYHLMKQAIQEFSDKKKAGQVPESIVFFLGRENFPQHYAEGTSYQLGRGQLLREGDGAKSVAIAANGSLVPMAIKASEALQSQGIGAFVINTSSVQPIDAELFEKTLEKTEGRLVTVEDHQTIGGMGSLIAHALLQKGVKLKLRSLGVEKGFGQSAYTADQLYQKHQIDSEAIVSAANKLLN